MNSIRLSLLDFTPGKGEKQSDIETANETNSSISLIHGLGKGF